MSKLLLLILVVLLGGCADYSTNASVDGLRKPSDMVPQPFPEPPPAPQN